MRDCVADLICRELAELVTGDGFAPVGGATMSCGTGHDLPVVADHPVSWLMAPDGPSATECSLTPDAAAGSQRPGAVLEVGLKATCCLAGALASKANQGQPPGHGPRLTAAR